MPEGHAGRHVWITRAGRRTGRGRSDAGEIRAYGGEVHAAAGRPQGTGERAAALRLVEAGERGVQRRAATGQPAPGVGEQDQRLRRPGGVRNHPQQPVSLVLAAAADAGADRRGAAQPTCSGCPSGAEGSGLAPLSSVSAWMSIRQPVSRAARRAFCPSLPMASDSW
jgi:hypothetical protein